MLGFPEFSDTPNETALRFVKRVTTGPPYEKYTLIDGQARVLRRIVLTGLDGMIKNIYEENVGSIPLMGDNTTGVPLWEHDLGTKSFRESFYLITSWNNVQSVTVKYWRNVRGSRYKRYMIGFLHLVKDQCDRKTNVVLVEYLYSG